MSGAPGTEGGAGSTKSRRNRKGGDLSAPPGGPALSARVRSLLAACPSWRTRFSAPRMHLLAPRALSGRKLGCIYFSSRTPSLFLSFFLYSTLSFPLYFPGETIKFSGL